MYAETNFDRSRKCKNISHKQSLFIIQAADDSLNWHFSWSWLR